MPVRFKKVDDLLYRGGAPKKWEIPILKKIFNITQIISLDQKSAEKIKKECKENNINRIVIPINTSNLYDNNLSIINQKISKLIDNEKTYVHCLHGKDRTGLFVAKYKIEKNESCFDALDEAISFGFGIGVNLLILKRYIDILAKTCQHKHNHIDLNYWKDKTNKFTICNKCGMTTDTKAKKCINCLITNSLIKNASIFSKDVVKHKTNSANSVVSESNNEDSEFLKEDGIGGGTEVSTIFNIPERMVTSKNRINLMAKANQYYLKKQSQQISFKIPQEEKDLAKKCIENLKKLVEDILFKTELNDTEIDILDIIYNPFVENTGITKEQASKIKQHIQIFTELLKNNLIAIKKFAYSCLKTLEKFDTDSDVAAMNESFYNFIDNLTKETDILFEILEDTTDKDFQQNIVNSIKSIKKTAAQLKQLINERIIPYLRKDILGDDWTLEIKKDIIEDVEENRR